MLHCNKLNSWRIFMGARDKGIIYYNINELDAFMQEYSNQGWFNGTVLVSHKGNVILKKGYGMVNFELDIPNSSYNRFRIASLSKAFTSQAILMLQDQGLLKVHDKVVDYLTNFPHNEVTIDHLLAHTSGLDDSSFSLEFWQRTQRIFHTAEERLEPQNKPLLFKPGTKVKYSNLGYTMLAAIIEHCSGLEYAEFLKRHIFEPLKMNHTGNDDGRSLIMHLASGYSAYKDQVIRAEFTDISTGVGAFSLYSSVEDLYLWYEKSLKQEPEYYNYGWGKGKQSNRPFFYLIGDVSGFRSYMMNNLDEDICIILLSNLNITPVEFISKQLARLVLGERIEIEQKTMQDEENTEFNNKLEGVYRSAHNNDSDNPANLANYIRDQEILLRLSNATSGYIANGRFFELFEDFNIIPSETFFVIEIQKKYFLFKQIRFSWFLLELSPIHIEKEYAEYVTKYLDSRLQFTIASGCINAVFIDPQGIQTEARKTISQNDKSR
jgi:CubicO group peptidase (beta-lactamase class C family)